MDKKLRDALFACTTDTHAIKALRGMYMRDDFITVSDSTVFIKLDRPFDMDEDLIDANGVSIDDKYPNIHGVIPELIEAEMSISMPDLRKAAELIPKSPDELGKRIVLNINGLCLYPPRVLKVVKVFEILGIDTADTYIFKNIIVFRAKGILAIISSVGDRAKTHPTIENYTMESILLMADLL